MTESISESRFIDQGDGTFDIAEKTLSSLEPGTYTSVYNNRTDRYDVKKKDVLSDTISLTNKISRKILDQINTFWNMEETYKKHEILHKRGFLLVGKAGCGKSSTIVEIVKQSIALGAIAFFPRPKCEGDDVKDCIKKIKTVEPNKKILIVMEDFETFVREDFIISAWLNVLDGDGSFNNIVFIATSNFPEKIDKRFTARPSRFDTIYVIAPPSKDDRIAYIKKKHPLLTEDMVRKYAKDTEEMSYASLKELLISTMIFNLDYEDTLARLLKNSAEPISSDDFEEEKIKIGFALGHSDEKRERFPSPGEPIAPMRYNPDEDES